MNLKTILYKIEDTSTVNIEQFEKMNSMEPRTLKTKSALVNFVKRYVESSSRWINITPSAANISTSIGKGANINITIDLVKKLPKSVSFNTILVYEETNAGLIPYNIQLVDLIIINKNVSSISINIDCE